MIIERIPILSRPQWLELRKPDVTASVVAALFGLHPYVTALKLYYQHNGMEFEFEETKPIRRGRLLENAVAQRVGEEHEDWIIEKCQTYFRAPELKLGATPDFFIHGDPRGLGILQTKTAYPRIFERDWDNGNITPIWTELQLLTEMMLTDAAFGVAAVIYNYDLDLCDRELPRHAGAEARIKIAVQNFWEMLRLDVEPSPDFGKDAELIKLISPREATDKMLDLSHDNELPEILAERASVMQRIASLEDRKNEIETQIRFKLGDAAQVTGVNGFKITYKTSHYHGYTVPERDTRVLRIHERKEDNA
jgi:predicted phage-related endonuclease